MRDLKSMVAQNADAKTPHARDAAVPFAGARHAKKQDSENQNALFPNGRKAAEQEDATDNYLLFIFILRDFILIFTSI